MKQTGASIVGCCLPLVPVQMDLLQLQEDLLHLVQIPEKHRRKGGHGRGEGWMDQVIDLQEDVAGLLSTATAR